MTLTIWSHPDTHAIRLHQLSDDPEDGTPEEQIAHIGTLEFYAGYECVSPDYTGSVPDSDPAVWRWDGSKVIAVEPVPAKVSRKQVRLLLLQQGLLQQVEAMIAQQDIMTQIEWQDSLEFHRDNPLLKQLAANIGLTPEQLDGFFIAAAKL